MNSIKYLIKSEGPKLVPFLKTVAIYFVILPSPDNPTLFSTVLKCLPIASLILFLLLHGMSLEDKFKYSRRILLGLMFCCIGDALLVWPGYFEAGMVSFAIGHAYYVAAFGFKPLNLTTGIAILAAGVAGVIFLLPGLHSSTLTVGVPIYILILSLMMWRSLSKVNCMKDFRNMNKICSGVGGLLFVISDLLLGVHMFKFKVTHAQALVMSSYYAAQLSLALSVIEYSQPIIVKDDIHLDNSVNDG